MKILSVKVDIINKQQFDYIIDKGLFGFICFNERPTYKNYIRHCVYYLWTDEDNYKHLLFKELVHMTIKHFKTKE